jgi:hypothetical protein
VSCKCDPNQRLDSAPGPISMWFRGAGQRPRFTEQGPRGDVSQCLAGPLKDTHLEGMCLPGQWAVGSAARVHTYRLACSRHARPAQPGFHPLCRRNRRFLLLAVCKLSLQDMQLMSFLAVWNLTGNNDDLLVQVRLRLGFLRQRRRRSQGQARKGRDPRVGPRVQIHPQECTTLRTLYSPLLISCASFRNFPLRCQRC